MKKIALVFILAVSGIVMIPGIGRSLGFEGVGGKIALVMPEGDADTNIGLGFIADLGTILPELNALKAEASAEYWGDSYDVGYWEWSWTAISFNGTAKYHFPLGGKISPYAGGGLGLTISRWSSDWKSTAKSAEPWVVSTETSDNDIEFGLNLVGGVDIPLGSGLKFTGEAKFSTAGSDTFQISGALVFKL